MHAIFLAAKSVGHIPVSGLCLARCAGATFDVLRAYLIATAVTTDIGTQCSAAESACDSGDILAAPAADLVTENSADDGAGNRSGNIGVVSILRDLFALHPASLFWWPDNSTY